MEAFIIIVVIALFALIVVFGIIAERKRKAALLAFAQESGLSYRPNKDRSLAMRYEYLNQLDDGRNRYVMNCFEGDFEQCSVRAFDHHHETTRTDSKGNRRTSHHWKTVAMVEFTPSLSGNHHR